MKKFDTIESFEERIDIRLRDLHEVKANEEQAYSKLKKLINLNILVQTSILMIPAKPLNCITFKIQLWL